MKKVLKEGALNGYSYADGLDTSDRGDYEPISPMAELEDACERLGI